MTIGAKLTESWIPLGRIAPDDLVEARMQAHWAAQIPAAVSGGFGDLFGDDRMGMQWFGRIDALVGGPVLDRFRVAVRIRDLSLLLLDLDGSEAAVLQLDGRTLREGFDWLREAIEKLAGTAPKFEFRRPGHDLPRHPVGEGGAFRILPGLEELSNWFANGDRVLQYISAGDASASVVRCWPRQFDMATLLRAERGRSIAVGLSPGDQSYRQPYWYCAIRPEPDRHTTLPGLRYGTWHRQGWTGAVLTGSKLTSASDQPGTVIELRPETPAASVSASRFAAGMNAARTRRYSPTTRSGHTRATHHLP